ncbi:DUF1223 domain-containing protein [Acuticoccus sp.]|uniref:DUF1223 domain-containing protein n=1 Tax=Acuticoccus sp. TaxID=1904378 RepID=UPI003B52EF14
MARVRCVVAAIPLAITASVGALAEPAIAPDESAPRAVLELFTSQGCSSCPAADAIVGELTQRDDVLAATMPVKLWDYLGWADTLATDHLTKRQIAYSVARGDGDVYTPQIVVNGVTAVVGSDEDAVVAAIEEASLPLPIELSVEDGILAVAVGDADVSARAATLWFMVLDEEVRVPVSSGENRGRQLTYHNVVRHMRPIGMWKGKPLRFDLPLSDLEWAASAGCAVVAQVETFKGPGRIIGAAELPQLFPARTVEVR